MTGQALFLGYPDDSTVKKAKDYEKWTWPVFKRKGNNRALNILEKEIEAAKW